MSQAGELNVVQNHPDIPTLFIANVGSATPLANELEILGSGIITTTGSGNTITITATSSSPETLTGNTGGAVPATANNINTVGTGSITIAGNPGTSTLTTQLTGLTNHSLLVGAGTPTITSLGVATNGQLPIGSTGADPVLATLTAGTGISITNGAGSITIAADGGVVLETLTGNTGGAISPIAGNINTVGTGSITIAGAGNTLTTQLTGLTNHNVLVGAGTATITNISPSTVGFVLTSNGLAADPSFQTISASGAITTITGNTGGPESPLAGNFNILGTGSITVAGSANTETIQLTGLTNHSLLVGAGTATITNLGVATNGQLPIGSTGADPVLATLTAGTGISITNGAGSITIAATGSEQAWTDEGTSFNAVAGNGYFITAAGVTATLPASPSQGNLIMFTVDAATTNFTITANTGQVIRIGSAVSAAAGTAVNTARGDSVTLVYRSSDTAWIARSVIGTWVVT